jgi:hypothetical protein
MEGTLDLSGGEVLPHIQRNPDAEVIIAFVFQQIRRQNPQAPVLMPVH